jgi:putative endonuclease
MTMSKQYFVYIMTNKNNTVLYTGIAGNLKGRAFQHREKLSEGFTKRSNVTKLVYYEAFDAPENAITREKQIKGGSRRKKIELIEKANSEWADLYGKI